ncbi:hypothetical protein A7L03_18755 [Acinetobacter baumannii]|nr:hypothetical protein A7L03_18755 [Acinetobacter baumannii]
MDVSATARSPSAISRLSHLDIPRAQNNTRESSEFAAGYNLGLIGGVRSWMARSRRNLNDSRPQSPIDDSSDEQEGARSPREAPRGRTGQQTKSDSTAAATTDTAA